MKRVTIFLMLFFIASITAMAQQLTWKAPHPNDEFRVGLTIVLQWDTVDTQGNRTWNQVLEFHWSDNGPEGDYRLLLVAKNKSDFKDVDSKNANAAVGKVSTVLPRKDNMYLRVRLKENPNVFGIVGPINTYQPAASVPDSVIGGNITGTLTLSSSKTYGLRNVLYVQNGGVLRIEPGTIIFGDPENTSAICVNRGGKIYANGTADKPIVMTSGYAAGSRDRGDWGGLLIMGNAETNLTEAPIEGGIADDENTKINGWFGRWNGVNNNDDSSGVLRYVRIEFAGIAESPDNELNGLTMGSVGRKTVIENVQVSYCGDDSFEWFGGTVDGKYLIAFNGIDDDFDTDNGFRGRIQFGLVYRFPEIADQSNSEAFESDNDSKASENKPFTSPIFSNITAIGGVWDTNWVAGVGEGRYNAKYLTAVQIRRNSRLSLFNSVLAGWPGGVELTNQNTVRAADADSLMVRFNNFYGIKNDKWFYFGSGTNPQGQVDQNWLAKAEFGNNFKNAPGNVGSYAGFQSNLPFSLTTFNPLPKGDAEYLNNARFDVPMLQDPFFEKVSFRGAFGTHRWDLPWAEYDPINKVYTASNVNDEPFKWDFQISASPNPANDYTVIEYHLPEEDFVNVKIFNSIGSLENIFIKNDLQAKGVHQFAINTSVLPTGVYYVQVITSFGVVTQQINVIR